MDRPIPAALYNMCMIYDNTTDQVLVQDKAADDGWGGITFPGGHVEPGESILASTIREVWEETGLTVKNLQYAGMIDYYNTETGLRWMCFLHKTEDFTGELIERTEEGPVFWTTLREMQDMQMAPNMDKYLTLFTQDDRWEAYAEFTQRKTNALTIL